MRMRPQRHLPSAVLLLWLFSALAALAAEPIVRAKVETSAPIVIGQQVTIAVDVLVPNFFLSPPKFPQFDLPSAIVTLQDHALNLVEKTDGVTYAGIRRTYLVIPQAAGDFALPQLPVTFTYAAVPGRPPANGSVMLPPERFTVAGIPGAAAGTGATVATKVAVTQALDRDLKGIRVGDTLVRTVTATAEGMQAMMIPAPDFTTPEGVRIYPQDPILSNETPRGKSSAEGKRIDRVTYAFERPGNYVLPAVEVGWYDPASRQQEVAKAPGIAVAVAERAAFEPGSIAPPEPANRVPDTPDDDLPRRFLRIAVPAAAIALFAWLGARALPKVKSWREKRRIENENSEAAHFQRFESACQAGDRMAARAALTAWARCVGIGLLTEWLPCHSDAATLQAYAQFERALYGAGGTAAVPDLKALGEGLARSRRAWLVKGRRKAARKSALPALNA